MNPAERLEASAQRFADTLSEAITTRVALAVALERDRHDSELATLRAGLAALTERVEGLEAQTGYSVKAGP